MSEQEKASEPRFQIIWRWRSWLWPFYICREDHCDGDTHLSYVGWRLGYFKLMTPNWGLSVVYRWILRVGPLEVRRLVPNTEMFERIRAHTAATSSK